jgi:hypothetical protein
VPDSASSLQFNQEAHVEEKKPRARYDAFAEQFIAVMYEHWSGILLVINRQSPRIATLLRVATPTGLKRMNGVWRIQVMARRVVPPEKLRQPRDNEVVAQAIRLYYYSAARLKLPRIVVEFET